LHKSVARSIIVAMSTPGHVDVLRVFTGPGGAGGNPLGVVLDGRSVPPAARQSVAAGLGFSESVFVDPDDRVAIHTPTVELPFAGHPLVGAAWLIARERPDLAALYPPAGPVRVRRSGTEVFVSGRPEWAPAYAQLQLGSPAEVDALPGAPAGHDLATAWAWVDEAAGVVRARVFPVGIGIPEDEATGANAVIMGAALGRPITILQGRGSRISARPRPDGTVEIGGEVTFVERRALTQAA
jgi:predicted PhzF superfamily epimerase YddE/YHI9